MHLHFINSSQLLLVGQKQNFGPQQATFPDAGFTFGSLIVTQSANKAATLLFFFFLAFFLGQKSAEVLHTRGLSQRP